MARKAMYLVFLVGVLLGVSLFSNSRVQAADDLEDETVTANFGKQKHGSATDDEVVQREEKASKLDGLSVAEINNLRESAEKHQFQAEVNRMMKLIINSLYRNNEIFLRDLISNASDALDKIRLLSLTNPNVLNDIEELSIRIKADKENHALHITDTGIGMTKADLINNLGTIACSGTSEFLSKLLDTATSAEQQEGLISQLGVGFCSSFLVADRVVFTTRKIHDEQYIWDSDSLSFSIVEDPRGNTLKRGSQVTLYLKEEAYDFLEPDTLKKLVQKYSKFINFDIFLWQSKTETVEEPEEKSEDSAFGEEKEPKTKNVEKTVRDWEKIKSVEPIWMRKGHDVPEVLTDIASSLKILTDIASSLKELINSSNESIASSLKELINSSNESIELLKKKGTTSIWAKQILTGPVFIIIMVIAVRCFRRTTA